MLDLRLPLGLMFSLVGILLLAYGGLTAANAAMYQRSLGINVNLWWGGVLLAFGAVMLVLAMSAPNEDSQA